MSKLLKLQVSGIRKYLIMRAYMRSLRRWLPIRRYVDVQRLGKTLRIDRNDLEQAYFETDCVREPENIFLFRALARQGLCKTFVDIGANYGHIGLKVLQQYARVLLVDANPNAVAFLSRMFGDQPNVEIRHCAVIDDTSIESVTLVVPGDSSGLAHIADVAADGHASFTCPAVTLDSLLAGRMNEAIYIKIDVEGLEKQVLRGGQAVLAQPQMIVGFEAWSRAAAAECCAFFDAHVFYFARFDFLDPSGALTSSWLGLLRAVVSGGAISVHRFVDIGDVPFDHFSQVIAVPKAMQCRFEDAIRAEQTRLAGNIDLGAI